ncbi:putative bifunctional diguanylate cyclase/phosphodiesterase [Rugamonas apoptosis]|uniref:EAL domain-containing protein n=1 Tax=Rugamonas apoptosis TaxID=2758570 RepID=A0A7W2IKY7_9BURK|nr:EAL domain-containing protein [Rugamonas apoptosis]MBA5687872.1 EAL domain-containing protein [Rugamonas apoptosis]
MIEPAPLTSPSAATRSTRPAAGRTLFGGLALLLVLVWLSPWTVPLKQSEVLFSAASHTIFELFAVVVAGLIFAVSWNAYQRERAGNTMILACGFLAVGLIDLAHLLSYKGMPDFVTPAAPQKAIAFWLCARFVAALTLLVVALRPWTRFRSDATRYLILGGALALTAAVYVLQLYAPEIWPVMFVPGQGLTSTKLMAEYGIVALLLVPLALFWRAPAAEATPLLRATAITILSELCFTLYANVNDIYSLLGHLYKVIAYGYIYQAVFVASVREPFLRLSAALRQQRLAEERLHFLAYHDPLTELPNRLMARVSFRDAVARANAGRVALVFIDLDNFKQINDSLGHLQGDVVLQEMANRLRALAPAGATVSRQGGDEFLLVWSGPPVAGALGSALDMLLQRLQEPIMVAGQELATTVSAGIALSPDDGADFDILLQKADTAMYHAKHQGRNTWCCFAPHMLSDAADRLDIRNGLAQALQRDELLLYYQPQFDLASGRMIGVEALIRWQRPGHGLVSPARFIPVAEECGLIVPIGAWVLRTACRQMAEWRAAGAPHLVVAVNLSALQFGRGNLEQDVRAALEQAGLPAGWLELELTESILLQNPDQVLAIVQRLRKLGVSLSVDDFGTGYSSLAYLKQFAVDKLKIDQSFVRAIDAQPDDTAIVRAIVQMAHSLGLKTIAEGVENTAVLDLLGKLGCDEAQGYHYARPLPAAEALPFILAAQAQAEAQAQAQA